MAMRPSTPPSLRTIISIAIVLCISLASFYVGVNVGINVASSSLSSSLTLCDCHCHEQPLPMEPNNNEPTTAESQRKQSTGSGSKLFSKSISHYAQGLVRVSKSDLMSTFDFGVPINQDSEGMDALILYNKQSALPSDQNIAEAARYKDPTKPLPLLSATTATENCDTMNVVLMNNPGSTRQCFALVGGQYQSYHIQRWMRRSEESGPITPNMPLILTSRAYSSNGRQSFVPPKDHQVKQHQERLLTYLTEAPSIKERLRQILEKMNQKTVVVLTCNLGQSELLLNFSCSARARGFDLSNVLVFPTDEETKELAEGIGLVVFYEEKLMASIPKQEAATYGDNVFANIMFAKVLCVQLVNELGYDLLFQDVDLVWFKSPLDFFHDPSLPIFDMYFQDDGNRQERFAPYSANSGFYFVRSNPKTRHFFRQFLYSSDLISAWYSHQAVLIALLGEHSSVMGLTVKVYPKEMEEFPGGLQFHRKNKKEMMKKIIVGNSKAYIFHMSWTDNKANKKKFFQQMGEWYLNDKCADGKDLHVILGGNSKFGVVSNHCCSAEPIITCFYQDKPSKIPCPDSPFIDKKGKSWW